MHFLFRLSIGLISFNVWGASELTQLSSGEMKDTEERIRSFYQTPFDSHALDRQGIKVDPFRRVPVELHPELKSEVRDTIPLLIQAQGKGSVRYQRWYCREVLQKIYPQHPCEGYRTWSDVQREDRLEDLVESWVEQPVYQLESLPIAGRSERPLWSDDFWAMARGLTSYRYAEGKWFSSYWEAVQAYFQPQEWFSLVSFPLEKIKERILSWSPAEKYDLSVRDEGFHLTLEQKGEGESYQRDTGEVEGWMGLCHGWAPAAIMVPRPEKPVSVRGPRGIEVVWYPNDIKAMVSLAWANGEWPSNFVGRRCEQETPQTYPNGRIKGLDCFDNNPATFHLALGNLIGNAKASFVMDKAYDYQVWNQPVVAYEFQYFNPLNPRERSSDWKEIAVNYDDEFKKKDRFQKPLTRGKFLEGPRESVRRLENSSQDGHIKKVVGVIATVVYLVETTPPDFGPLPGKDILAREVFLYDLEIAEVEGQWSVTGGEWHQNNHPDFLFVPKKNSNATSYWDWIPVDFDPHSFEVSAAATRLAEKASSRGGYPLCEVLKPLVEASQTVGGASYSCPYSSTIP